MSRDEQYIEFMKEYRKLCGKYGMELALYDVWDDGDYSIQLYDRMENIFNIEFEW